MKRAVLILAGLLLFAAPALASDAAKEVNGAWKSQTTDSLTGKPRVIVIQDDKVVINTISADAVIERRDGKILFRRAGETEAFLVATVKSADVVHFANMTWNPQDFTRISPEEANQILSAPSALTSKPDPF